RRGAARRRRRAPRGRGLGDRLGPERRWRQALRGGAGRARHRVAGRAGARRADARPRGDRGTGGGGRRALCPGAPPAGARPAGRARRGGGGVTRRAGEQGGPGERVFAGSTAGLDVLEVSWKSVRAPLPPAAVTAIAPSEDALWIGTDQGLVRMSRAVLETALA